MVLPVMNRLKFLLPDLQCVLLAVTTGYAKAVAAGVTPIGYKDLLHLADTQEVEHWGRKLYTGISSPDVSKAESIAYLGINYLDLIAQHGETGAAAIYAQHGRYGFKPLHLMRRLLDEIRPHVVVTTNSPRSERAALEVAIERGIPNVGMVDLFAQDEDSYIDQVSKPDWTCVIAQSVKQRLVERGFADESVVVTGNPAFDGLFSPTNRVQACNFVEHLGWQSLSPILWAGQVEPLQGAMTQSGGGLKLAIEVETALRDLICSQENLALIIRYHPSHWHAFPRFPDRHRVHFSVPSSEPIHPIILSTKAVVVQNSTVGLEAAVAGIPVVSLEYSPSVQASFSLACLGVARPCNSIQALPGILHSMLADGAAMPGQFASDGHATERVAKIVQNALS